MPFSIGGFLIGEAIGKNNRITDQATLARLGFIGALFGLSARGIVITTVLAQRGAPTAATTTTAPSPQVTGQQVIVPNVVGLMFDDSDPANSAVATLQQDPLKLQSNRVNISAAEPIGEVVKQDPEEGVIVVQGATVTLWVSA